jgi:hypothetical protein
MQSIRPWHSFGRFLIVVGAMALLAQNGIAQSRPEFKSEAAPTPFPKSPGHLTPKQMEEIVRWIADFGSAGCYPGICSGGSGPKPTGGPLSPLGPAPTPPEPLAMKSLSPDDRKNIELGLAMIIKFSGANPKAVEAHVEAISSRRN